MEVSVTSSIKVLGLGSLLILSACGPAKDMPSGMVTDFFTLDSGTTKFASLPLEGSVEEGQKFWSGDHWPLRQGIINRRWRSPFQDAFDTHSPTKTELSYMSEDEIAQLAPSEKYDLLMGEYDYPLKKEVSAKSNRGALNWEGIGNGWAAASANHEEPVAVVLQNPDGINIPFGTSDIKALLSYYYANYHTTTIPQLGIRCEEGFGDAEDTGCEDDLSASSFHIAITNQIGVNKRPLIADVDRYKDVWNHPIHSFLSEVTSEEAPSEGSPANAVKTMVMRTRISYTDKTGHNSWDPLKDTWNQSTVKRVYTYNLYLDAEGNIIGGKWRSSDRPDFMWGMGRAQEFSGYYSQLSKLIND
jgi:hypothetical protein